MNKQFKMVNGVKVNNKIEWTDYTWNPIVGCHHGCRWEMPDGKIAVCYAETQVEGRWLKEHYPDGFETTYWKPERLKQPGNQKAPAKIFVCSLSDLFGHWVENEHIDAVLDVARRAPWHTFQLLTKNPVRTAQFDIPQNCWVGCSTPPDEMWGKRLSDIQKRRMLERSLSALGHLKAKGVTTWVSAEPLSWDVMPIFGGEAGWVADPHQCSAVDWVVIGAASNGSTYHQPDPEHVRTLLDYCYAFGIKVFFKGNLRPSLGVAFDAWREEFPS